MEVDSLVKLRQLEPELRLGWTYPKTRRDWTQHGWAVPGIAAGLAAMRRRFPKILASRAPQLDVDAVWAYHQIVTPRLVEAADQAGVELITWTVDELDRMVALLKMGVHGVCSNDPRLFAQAERIAADGEAPGAGGESAGQDAAGEEPAAAEAPDADRKEDASADGKGKRKGRAKGRKKPKKAAG
jgi:hypothetical protein